MTEMNTIITFLFIIRVIYETVLLVIYFELSYC